LKQPGCELCEQAGGEPVFSGPKFRVIRAAQPGIAAFYRLVWNDHAAEFTDLAPADRALCMEGVAAVESVLREVLAPTKINLATLGNVVPHLHWHLIARFDWDSNFPQPVWAAPVREADAAALARVEARRPVLEQKLSIALQTLAGPATRP
jgi:diadenosine tetraphosphate (Ap4A) HIT family hydrolase